MAEAVVARRGVTEGTRQCDAGSWERRGVCRRVPKELCRRCPGAPDDPKQERLLHRLLAAAHATDVVAAFVTKTCTFYKNIKSIFAHYPLVKHITKW